MLSPRTRAEKSQRSSPFQQMLERLADEHEREVTVLKTEVTELRTQLGVLDPTSKYMNRTTNKSLNFGDVMERWKEGHKCTPKKTAANLTVQELPSMHVPQVMQVWAEKKRLAQTQRGEQAPTDDATGPAERPKVPTNSNTPEDDWPPPVPANTTPAEKFWISFDDQSKRSAGEEEEAGKAAEDADGDRENSEEEKAKKPQANGGYDPSDKDSMVKMVSRYAKQLRGMNSKMEVLMKELNKARTYTQPRS
mmetsp:Transcript_11796/g.33333  ORF Transcript_11796/g.33333 Transcript_11796/m.33333 type:complete len:250 (+) Transcript_11796:140-889(+)